MRRVAVLACLPAFLCPVAFAQDMSPPPARPSAVVPEPLPPPGAAPKGEVVLQPPPSLPVDENASPRSYLEAARVALATGRADMAEEALERAETRVLVRSVRPSRAGDPSRQTLVEQIGQARAALGAGDRERTMRIIEEAIANPESEAGVE